jgi:hypothetical protein
MSEEKRDGFDGEDARPYWVSSLHGRWESLTCNDRAGSQENEVEPDGRDSPPSVPVALQTKRWIAN